jgi:hypothetical protein
MHRIFDQGATGANNAPTKEFEPLSKNEIGIAAMRDAISAVYDLARSRG